MVGGYDQEVWDQHKRTIVTRGSYAKFTQNTVMGQHLLDTGEKVSFLRCFDRQAAFAASRAREKGQFVCLK